MRRLMGALSTAALVLALAATTGQAGPAALAPQDATLQPTGMTTLVDVSKDGRIALGKVTETGPYVIRDVVRNRTLRRLKSGSRYSYKSISSTGRYVHFTKSHTRDGCTYERPWVYDRITRKSRLAAATRTGKPLRATWSRANQCPYISYDGAAFGMRFVGGPGQMSPDGRYVAFCANLKDPDRGDLYIKNMKTRKLTIRKGLCHLTTEAFEFYPVHVSESARTIMVLHNDANSTWDHRATLVLKRRATRELVLPGDAGARDLWLTDDGRSIFYGIGGAADAGRYDTRTGTVTALSPGDPLRNDAIQPGEEYRDAVGMTRRGRYATYNGFRLDPALGRVGMIGVFDRQTGQAVDLTTISGMALQVGNPPMPNSLVPIQISGDGRVVFVGTSALRWKG